MNFSGIIRLNKCGAVFFLGLFVIMTLYLLSKPSKEENVSNLVNLRKLLIAAIEVAEKGGKEISTVYSLSDINVKSKGKTKEGADDPLTNADKKSHCVMYFGLTRAFPKVKIISEEDGVTEDCNLVQLVELDPRVLDGQLNLVNLLVPVEDVTVWIDPLDATQEFTENLLEYVTTMVCVAVRGEPVIGVIHRPFGPEPQTTWSWADKAMSSDLKNIKKTDSSEESLKFIVSRSHAGVVEKLVKEAFGSQVAVIPAGGAGYKVMEVIAGNASAYIHTTNIKKWDICAGNAILNAVGGKMTTLKNDVIDYSAKGDFVNKGGLISTMTANHDKFVDKLAAANANA